MPGAKDASQSEGGGAGGTRVHCNAKRPRMGAMSSLLPLLQAWDEAHREFAIALDGMPDEELWRRPHPRLLSVGELAGHVAYWQAVRTAGGEENLAAQSPLIDPRFRYYTGSVEAPVVLSLTTEEVLKEVARIHDDAKAALGPHELDDPYPGWGTYGNMVQYQVFHVAYHTGQAYSARHLLGHTPEDN